MNSDMLPYIVPLAVSAAVGIGLLVFTWTMRSDPIAPWFTATLVAFLIWTVGYLFEIVSTGLEAKVRWADLQFVGVTLLPVAWYEVVKRYTGRGAPSRPLSVLLMAFVPVSMLVVYFNPAHAFRGTPSLETVGPFVAVVPDYGWYWAFVIVPVAAALLLAATVMLVQSIWRDRQALYRRQYILLLAAGLLPMATTGLFLAGAGFAEYYNPTTAVAWVSGAIMAYALFRYRLFDVAPMARGAVVDNLSDGVIVLDTYDRVVDFNPAARQLFPDLGREALGRPVADVLAVHPGLIESVARVSGGEGGGDPVSAELSMAVPGESGKGETTIQSRHFTLEIAAVRGRTGRLLGHSVLLHDVTRSVELLRQVERLATTDPLTELLNRKAFLELGEREMTRARRQGFSVWLVLLDLDHFSMVNDLHGADVGDEVIRAVSRSMRRLLRAFDMVGRYAGEEFVMLLPYLSREEALEMGERLRQAVEGLSVWKDDQLVSVTASVGIAGVEHARREYLSDLLAPAEQALREARGGGRNRVVCGPPG